MDKVVEQSLMDIPGGRVSSIGKGWQSWPATFFSFLFTSRCMGFNSLTYQKQVLECLVLLGHS